MTVTEIESKSILIKHKRIDSWFLSRYGMNLYRGCLHNCAYCDGRAEKYGVNGEFGSDVEVKANAFNVLKRELDPRRKRAPFKGGYFMLGGGVGDSYQALEKDYMLTRGALRLMHRFGHPVHILTKSTLVERDLDVIGDIKGRRGAVLSFSLSSVDDDVSRIFEPGVPPPSERLDTIRAFKERGIPCGVFLMPVIPLLTDDLRHIDDAVSAAKDAGADFVVFGGMTLKDGRQKEHFYDVLGSYRPDLIDDYEALYTGDRWGNAAGGYYQRIGMRFQKMAQKHSMPPRMPPHLFEGLLDLNDKVAVMLEHMEHITRAMGKTSSYGRAAHEISNLQSSISDLDDLTSIRGVGQGTASLIREIMDTGSSKYYEKLMGIA
ncbi:MAG TPA: radical SAM protein [Candidatus Methanofastidiosa archaeon]|nr:radical SAM protein [Candidatus Methanofastidiosa archaeon]